MAIHDMCSLMKALSVKNYELYLYPSRGCQCLITCNLKDVARRRVISRMIDVLHAPFRNEIIFRVIFEMMEELDNDAGCDMSRIVFHDEIFDYDYTVADFIKMIEPKLDSIMHCGPGISTTADLKYLISWAQPSFYKHEIPEVNNYFAKRYHLQERRAE